MINPNDNGRSTGRCLGIRHLQVAVMSISTFIGSTMYGNIGVAIVSMVDARNDTQIEDSTVRTFDWDEKTQGYVLSSFLWGYILSQVPAGVLSEKFGGHRILCAAILASSLSTIIFPQCVYIGGWMFACVNRMILGLSQGFIYPSIFTLLGLWAPPAERGTFTSISIGAQLPGLVVTNPFVAFLCLEFGWPSSFYVLGAIGVIICPVLFFFGADSPSKHRLISDAEQKHIHSSLGGPKTKLTVPWIEIFRSAPVLSSIFVTAMQSTVLMLFIVEIPTFLATVHKFGLEENGLISSLPFLVEWALTFVFAWISDYLIDRGYVRNTTARKLFNSIGHFGAAVLLLLLAHSESRISAVVFLTLAIGVQAGIYMGVLSSFVDISPNFTGAISGVTNVVTNGIGLWGSIIVGHVVTEKGSTTQWRYVFYACSAILALSNVIYLIWGTSETQWWNWPDKYKNKEEFMQCQKSKERIRTNNNEQER